MEIKEMLAYKGSKCRPGIPLSKFIGVTIHNTGNSKPGADALSHGKYLQGAGKDTVASWHYAVDENCIVQSIPKSEIAWHAGDGKGDGNYKTIVIEICMNSNGDIKGATDKVAELTSDILKRHGINKAEGYVFQHNHWSMKNCPEMLRKGIPYEWKTFINKVQVYIDIDNDKPSTWAKEAWDWGIKKGITDGSNPKEIVTREQALLILYRVMKEK